jgi:hypothetical protein
MWVDATFSDVNIKLYDLAYKALTALTVDSWSFMVLNRTGDRELGHNNETCIKVKEKIDDGNSSKPEERRIRVARTIIVNCADPKEVGDELLEQMLNYLVANIESLDKRYMHSFEDRLPLLQKEIDETLEKARRALDASTPHNYEEQRFKRLFDELWGELANALNALVGELEAKRSEPHPKLAEYFENKFDLCSTDEEVRIPDLKEIDTERNVKDGYRTVYEQSMIKIRTRLTHHFVGIDNELKVSMDHVKREVAEVFMHVGRLREITKGATGIEFFKVMAEQQLSKGLSKQREIFEAFVKYELSLQGFFMSRIRSNLDALKPDKTTFQLPPNREAKDVQECLIKARDYTVNRLRTVMDDWLSEPSDAAFAVVEEFKDQFLYAQDSTDDWKHLYSIMRADIWQEFRESEMRKELSEKWQMYVNEALRVNAADSLHFFGQQSTAAA